ncbi:uncharacterized protein LOC115881766 isoform X2 [Sitophilus oryzae]|uniref:Uncharacterized protein LOC115881766 isoform X2 n=1 Tax=Sitophilus oryzae TaxID=7048 RepID=A0A6J2XW41_SITOR|nr:uncharacterized protein LOC115881766 isoform X2 [Sitophilus oryzae]
MRSLESNVLDAGCRVPSFSIIIDDFDSSSKESSTKDSSKPVQDATTTPPQSSTAAPRVYTRSYSDASIKKILEEAEHRKHEFWKLLDEHNAVIENLKRIEKLERKII